MSRTRVEILAQNVDIESTLALKDGSTTRLYIDSSGNLAIGNNTSPAGALDVTGNIVVSGTVDGRDVAVDGAKLDLIEAGATADQTAAEIKTAYESNTNTNAFTDAEQTKLSGIATGAEVNVNSDWNATTGDAVILNKPSIPTDNAQLTNGAGYITSADGGDAATIDGLDSTQFLRSDTYDESTAGLRIRRDNSGTEPYIGLDIENTATSAGIAFDCQATGGRKYEIQSAAAGSWFVYDRTSSAYRFSIDSSGVLRQGNINGNTIWHAGNDGSGSGLDADTVDGIQASNFVRSDVDDTKSGQLAITGSGQYVGNYGYSTLVLQDTSGYPGIDFRSGTKDWLQRMEAGTDMQWVYRDNGNYTERMELTTGGVLTVNGNTVWHAGNDGSGSGLDADLLDGQNLVPGSATVNTVVGRNGSGDIFARLIRQTYQNQSTISGGMVYRVNNAADNYLRVCSDTGAIRTFLNVPTRTGGDASGTWNISISGDAGTLDGIDSSSFLRSDTADTATGTLTFSGGWVSPNGNFAKWQISGGNPTVSFDARSDGGTGARLHKWNSPNLGGGSYQPYQEAWYDGDSYHYLKVESNTFKYDNNTVWHTGNDGSGSGLDADTLDGQQGSYYLDYNNLTNVPAGSSNADTLDNLDSTQFLRSHASDTVSTYSNIIQFYSNTNMATASGSQSSLQCYSSGTNNDAFMTFHVGGDYACYFGLDGGINDIAVGGWSMGATTYRVWHAGNDGAASGLDAALFNGIQSSQFLRSDANDVFEGGSLGFGVTTRQMLNLYSTSYGIGVQSSTMYCRSGSRFSWHRGGSHSNTENDPGTNGVVAMTLDGSSNLVVTGNVTAYSDINLKENIEVIPNALEKVAQIRGITYDRKDMGNSPRHAGVIAQEVEVVLPEVVTTDENGVKSVAYGNLVGLLIEAVKELKAEVETLKKERN